MSESVPVLETQRLRLRRHERRDFADAAAMWADPEVTRHIGGKPSTAQQTWSRLLGYVGHWELMGFGYRAIEDRRTHEFVGEVGLADFRRDITASMRDVPELGFALVPKAHAKGIATEAALAALAWSDANIPYARTVCLINGDNERSLRVAEKCGYRVFERGEYAGNSVLFLERERHNRSM